MRWQHVGLIPTDFRDFSESPQLSPEQLLLVRFAGRADSWYHED